MPTPAMSETGIPKKAHVPAMTWTVGDIENPSMKSVFCEETKHIVMTEVRSVKKAIISTPASNEKQPQQWDVG
jgi:hypothetical protein